MSEVTQNSLVTIDLGKQKRRRVKNLRQGAGRLMDDVETAIAELTEQGVIAGDAQPVIVIVERKQKRPRFPRF